MIGRALVVFAAIARLPARCESMLELPAGHDSGVLSARPSHSELSLGEEPLRMEPLDQTAPPIFVMRGGSHGPGKLVFVHGMCGHALGYAQSFQRSAARYGLLIAPQGDIGCGPGSPWAKWSMDTAALDARIVSAFHALGVSDPVEDITAIGYSQGASRAEALARRWPKRYTRLILIAGPAKVSPYGLHVQSALLMAGSLDRQDMMQASARAFIDARQRSRYMQLPDARHGSMGSSPELTMSRALDWLYESPSRPPTDGGLR